MVFVRSFLTKENKLRFKNSNYKNEKLRKRLEEQAKLDERNKSRSLARKRKFDDDIASTEESSSTGQNQYLETDTLDNPIGSSSTSSHHDSTTAKSSNASAGSSSPGGT